MAPKLFLSFCLFATLVALVPAPPVNRGEALKAFLIQYGYLDGKSPSEEEFREALKEFQKTYKLEQTGEYSQDLEKFITGARCGNPDKQNSELDNFVVRTPWSKRTLTYKFGKLIRSGIDLTRTSVPTTIDSAFQVWANAVTSGLQISEARRKEANDFDIGFYAGDHSDGYPFDGPGGVLGHAFYPENGKIHFDSTENWSGNYVEGYNLEYVAVHEIGHALGLKHSLVEDAVMYPYYPELSGPVTLTQDDIDGINTLYP